MMRTLRTLVVFTTAISLLAYSAVYSVPKGGNGRGKQNHHSGQQLLGEKIKTNGRHVLEKKGDYEADVDVKNGKIAGVHVKNAKKGDIPVKKYKTDKKMVRWEGSPGGPEILPAADAYLGVMYIGYAYVDEWGYEEIYWFPYDMILDGDTGAVWYVPSY